LRKTGNGNWKVGAYELKDVPSSSYPGPERSVLENARSLVEFAQSCLKSNAEALNKPGQIDKRTDDQVRKTQRQIESLGSKSNSRTASHRLEEPTSKKQSEALDLDAIDYLEASTLDRSPLSVLQVESYFARFGSLIWCLQAGSAHTVIFKFAEKSLNQFAMNYGHYLDQRPLALQAMKNGGVPMGRPCIAEASSAPRPTSTMQNNSTTSSTSTASAQDPAVDMSRLAALSPEEFAIYINSLR